MKAVIITADTPLSALFSRKKNGELAQVINSWKPFLIGCPSDVEVLKLTRFEFDKNVITSRQVYMTLIDLIEIHALSTSMLTLAKYLYEHTNLSQSESTLYQLLTRYRREWLENN